jgi:murein DD-endopeptidase MepM/ murein hydrolase activator NlpD
MKPAYFFSVLPLVMLLGAGSAQAGPLQAPARLFLGQPALVKLALPGNAPEKAPQLWFMERNFPLHSLPGNQGWVGIIGADLRAQPGQYVLRVEQEGRVLARHNIAVSADAAAGVRNIKVEEKYASPPAQVMERINLESQKQMEIYQLDGSGWQWAHGLNKPLDSAVVGKFGRGSIINGQIRAPHGGVDLRGATGAPVQAPASGRVVLTMDSYFSGLMILLDHGQGLISGYRHLSAMLVKEGGLVTQGQIIGRVGASGRVTGPHLHFDIHLKNAVLDPLEFIRLSREMAELIQEHK